MHEFLLNNTILFKINALLKLQMFNSLCVPNFLFVSLQDFWSNMNNSGTRQPWGKLLAPIFFLCCKRPVHFLGFSFWLFQCLVARLLQLTPPYPPAPFFFLINLNFTSFRMHWILNFLLCQWLFAIKNCLPDNVYNSYFYFIGV